MSAQIYQTPEVLLQQLIRFNTVNPPGNERDCILYIKSLLDEAGIENKLYALEAARPSLWAVIRSDAPVKAPVLMYGHVDVVPVEGQNWSVDPFAGVIKDGMLYGRGAIDMKSAVAMYLCAMLKVKYEGIALPYDLCFLALPDEEARGTCGAKFMVERHPELFDGITCAMGEIGGFSLSMGGKRFYPIMIAEKQIASVRITFFGEGGHGSVRRTETAVTKLSAAVTALAKQRLRVRITPPVARMVTAIAKGLGGVQGVVLPLLLRPALTDRLLDLLGKEAALFDNLLHNNLNITMVSGGSAINVIPASVYADGDLRLLPGCSVEEAIADIEAVLRGRAGLTDKDFQIEVTAYEKNDTVPDTRHFDAFRNALLAADPDGIPIPFVLGAVTDGRILAKLGVTTYGFTPMRLPEDFDFAAQAHNADERIPVDALPFGVNTLMGFLTKHY